MRPIITTPSMITLAPQQQVEPGTILKLPNKAIHLVLSRLSMQDLKATALTCKHLSAQTIKAINAHISNPYNPHLIAAAVPKHLIPVIKRSLPFMYANLPMHELITSYLLGQTSASIFESLRENNGEPLAKANGLALDKFTPWKLLTSNNSSHITHIELDANWLESDISNHVLVKIRTCFPNLISCSFKIQTSLSDSLTPLHIVAQKGLPNLVPLTISAGANIHAKDAEGATPLHNAAYWGHTKTASALMGAGADLHAKNNGGETPLHEAAFEGHTETATVLIDGGADVHAKDVEDATPLHNAAYRKNKEITLLLIKKGAKVNAKNDIGRTPLHLAVSLGHTETALALLEAGAEINNKDNNGETPLYIAADRGHKDTATALIDAGAEIHSQDNSGETPLEIAVKKRRI